jgi:cyclophilin family peptidyl-prolyl cis-trans isomerase
MEALNSGKKVMVEHKIIFKDILSMSIEEIETNTSDTFVINAFEKLKNNDYLDFDDIFLIFGRYLSSEDIKRIIKEGKWYIEP